MNNFNNNHKLILLGIIAVLVMFFSYNLYLSPYQKCVSGLIEEGDWQTIDRDCERNKLN